MSDRSTDPTKRSADIALIVLAVIAGVVTVIIALKLASIDEAADAERAGLRIDPNIGH